MRFDFTIDEIEKMTKKELYEIAKELNIRGRSRMRKGELLEEIKRELLLIEMASEEESITSNFIPQEPVEEEVGGGELPTYSDEFLSLIPVNPELSLAVWNVVGEKAVLRLYSEKGLVFQVEVNPEWRKYYIRYRAPFGRVSAELEVFSKGVKKVLRSKPITLPSDVVVLEVEGTLIEGILKEVEGGFREVRLGYGGRNG